MSKVKKKYRTISDCKMMGFELNLKRFCIVKLKINRKLNLNLIPKLSKDG
jgi:hypothetical protein